MLTEVHHLGRVPAGKRYRYLQILEATDVVEAKLREEIAQHQQNLPGAWSRSIGYHRLECQIGIPAGYRTSKLEEA